ncbi:MAG: radical SAM protein [Candidatus Methylomirabilis sp.]|nr:radical SAM protein [Deltaproteobacteria bacterium]
MHRILEKGGDPADAPNLAFRREGHVVTTPAHAYLDMDRVPRPALDLLPRVKYRLSPPFGVDAPQMLIETTRGCSYRCSFCTLPHDMRERSVDLVVEELVDLVHRRGYRELYFVDPTFTMNRERTMRLLDAMIRERIKVRWTCKTRADHVDQELLHRMAEAGCYMVSYGLESGSQRILDNLMKDVDVSRNERCIQMTRNAGMRSIAYILIGSPGEDELTVGQTLRMVRRMKPDFVLYGELQADPASAATKNAITAGAYSMQDVVDFYIGGKARALADKTLTDVPREAVLRWISQANRDFYARPSYIARRLADVRTPRDFGNLFAGVFFVLADKFLSADAI